jgi:hypothetical protein
MGGLPWGNWVLQCAGIVASDMGAKFNSKLDIRGVYAWLVSNMTVLVV